MAFEEGMYDTDLTYLKSLLRKAKRQYHVLSRPFPQDSLEGLQLEAKHGEKLHTLVVTDGPLNTTFGFGKHDEIIGMLP